MSGLAAVSPAKQLAAIISAGENEHSVHYEVSWTHAGTEWPDIIGDSGRSIGVQYITWHKAGRIGKVTVIATSSAAYVRGDAFALTTYMLLPSAGATKYANRWILIPKAASGYPTVSAGVRLQSAIASLRPAGALTLVPNAQYDHKPVLGVQGKKTPAVVTLYAHASGSPLPIAEIGARGASRFAVMLTRWNEPVAITPPSGATPISVVVATP